jgi:gentisate 1,2-dioxygenase
LANDRKRQTVHQTREEAENQMFTGYRLSKENPATGAESGAQRGGQSERLSTDRSGRILKANHETSFVEI